MNVLVTGATGFLGTHLCARLKHDGHDVVALGSRQADLCVAGSLDGVGGGFDQIYHLAAWTQAGDFCLHHPGEQWVINQQINTNVLHWWQRSCPAAKLIAIGTSCSYDPSLPHVEDNYLVGEPTESLFTYAHTKRMLLVGLRALERQFGLRYLYVVPSTLYGPGYHTDGRQMHFIFDLIRKILRGRRHGDTVTLWGDGYQRREVVHVDDFVDALIALTRRHDNDIVNIGAGGDHSIRSFAGAICGLVGYDAEQIVYDEARYVGARSKRLEVDKLRALLPGWQPRSLAAGLRQTIDWFQEHEALIDARA
jgi:GDP-L-fucose synthase